MTKRGNHEAWSQGFPRSAEMLRSLLPVATMIGADIAGVLADAAVVPMMVANRARTELGEALSALAVHDGVPAGTGRVAGAHGMTTAVTAGSGGEILVDAGHRVLLWLWPRSGARAPPESVRVRFVT